MINEEAARRIANNYISSLPFESFEEDKLIIIDEYTIEKPYGWIFSYNTEKFFQTRDYDYALVSNGPIIVNKETGAIEAIGGGPQMKKDIEEYELKILKE
jgi:Immunity protein 35